MGSRVRLDTGPVWSTTRCLDSGPLANRDQWDLWGWGAMWAVACQIFLMDRSPTPHPLQCVAQAGDCLKNATATRHVSPHL